MQIVSAFFGEKDVRINNSSDLKGAWKDDYSFGG